MAKKKGTTGQKKEAISRPGGKTRSGEKNSLVGNINRRKKTGKSRSKTNSTISDEAYAEMRKGWPKKASRKKKT